MRRACVTLAWIVLVTSAFEWVRSQLILDSLGFRASPRFQTGFFICTHEQLLELIISPAIWPRGGLWDFSHDKNFYGHVWLTRGHWGFAAEADFPHSCRIQFPLWMLMLLCGALVIWQYRRAPGPPTPRSAFQVLPFDSPSDRQ